MEVARLCLFIQCCHLLLQALGSMLIYPNSMSFDIMEGGGVPPPPQGMLLIKVLCGSGLKGKELTSKIDPFVEVSFLQLLPVN